MNEKKIEFNLDCSKMGNQLCLKGVRQGDVNSTNFVMNLTNGNENIGVDSDSVILMYGLKPDGTKLCNSCTTDEQGNIVYTLGTQDTLLSGLVQYQLVVSRELEGKTSVIASPSFSCVVESRMLCPTYTLLCEEPEDWTVNYNSYFVLEDGCFVKLNEAEKPSFEHDKYYRCDGVVESSDSFDALTTSLLKVENLYNVIYDNIDNLTENKETISENTQAIAENTQAIAENAQAVEKCEFDISEILSAKYTVALSGSGEILYCTHNTVFMPVEIQGNAPEAKIIIAGKNVEYASTIFYEDNKFEKIYVFDEALVDSIKALSGYSDKISVEVIERYNYISDIVYTIGSGSAGNGTAGADGLSAYEVAVENGFEGTEERWLESLKGEQGIQGEKGDKGDTGETGADGYTPVKGTDYFTNSDKTEMVEQVKSALAKDVYVSMPKYANVKVGSEFKIYYRNIISLQSALLWVGYNENLTTHYYDEYMTIIPTAEGSHILEWKLYDGNNALESGSLTIVASENTASEETTALVIGDSFINAGVITQKVLELYGADEATLTLLGTRGTSPNLHEGRGGWHARGYCTKASDTTYGVNPFYNNGFDFAYYMENQGYSGVQVVVINLGINDVFSFKGDAYESSENLNYFNRIVSSILAYDSNIKIILNLPTTPNSDGTSFTDTYGTTQIQWLYNRNIIRFAKELRDYFAGNSSVVVSASNCILDTKTQINDGVHPTTEGYNALGQRLYEVMINVSEGVAVEVDYLNLTGRTQQTYTVNQILPEETREMDATKCYATYLSGKRGAYFDAKITSFTTTENSVAIQVSSTSGYGMEFPMPQLSAGKTYTFSGTTDVSNARVYLLKYNSDTTYNANELLFGDSSKGNFSVTITPEEGYLYSIAFIPITAELCTYSNLVFEES